MKSLILNNKELSEEDKYQIYVSLSCRIGFIETNTIHRVSEYQKINKNFKPKILEKEQMKLITRLEEIMEELL